MSHGVQKNVTGGPESVTGGPRVLQGVQECHRGSKSVTGGPRVSQRSQECYRGSKSVTGGPRVLQRVQQILKGDPKRVEGAPKVSQVFTNSREPFRPLDILGNLKFLAVRGLGNICCFRCHEMPLRDQKSM